MNTETIVYTGPNENGPEGWALEVEHAGAWVRFAAGVPLAVPYELAHGRDATDDECALGALLDRPDFELADQPKTDPAAADQPKRTSKPKTDPAAADVALAE